MSRPSTPQATFFVACLSLDCRRLSSRRNGLCPCYRHQVSPSPQSPGSRDLQEPTLAAAEGKQAEAEGAAAEAPSLAQRCFHVVGGWVLSPPGVVIVLGVAAAFLAGGVYGATQLQQVTLTRDKGSLSEHNLLIYQARESSLVPTGFLTAQFLQKL